MRIVSHATLAIVLVAWGGNVPTANAADAPSTMWSFLGIPQGMQKLRDTVANRRGNHPKWERKPPLKKIADPANLEAENPAIKAAAKIKAEEDLAPQKIKAIKYLATVGCGCYPGVKEALLAALSDCTEDIRYEAAIAFCEASGNPCSNCNRSGCCAADVMTKLQEMAYEQDDKCCYKEPSARVRAVAANALKACRRVHRPAPAPAPVDDKEVPIEVPQPAELKETSAQAARPPVPATQVSVAQSTATTPRNPIRRATRTAPIVVNPVSLSGSFQTGEAEVADGLLVACRNGCSMRCPAGCSSRRCRHRHRPGTYIIEDGTIVDDEGAIQDEATLPGDVGALTPDALDLSDQYAATPSGLASAPGGAYGPQSVLPNMIGDNFAGAGMSTMTIFQGIDTNPVTIRTLRPGTSVVGRLKIAENSTPLPRDRIFLDYSFFDNVAMFAGGVDVNRFTPGFEKTFCDGLMSLEIRTPMAVTLDSTLQVGGGTDLSHGEFGNMGLTFKALMMRRPTWALAGGMTAVLPTADDVGVSLADGTAMVRIRNDATHLQPYFGALWTPNDRFFAQGFLQWDVATNGNAVFVNQGSGLEYVGDASETTFQFLDIGAGYWLYRGHQRYRRVTGLACTAEWHWNTSLQPADVVTAGSYRIGSPAAAIDISNLTVGVHLELYNKTTMTLAYVTPLGGGSDRQFDSEVRLLFNRRFGPISRAARTPL